MRTIEDILADLQAILDTADGRTLTNEECQRYEALEQELVDTRRSEEIRNRNAAYNTPAPGQNLLYGAAPARPDDGLERAFEAYLRSGTPNADISGLAVRNDQGVGTSAGGGYLVPTTMRQKIVEVMQAYGGLAAAVDSFSTGDGSPVEYPTLDDTANSGSIAAEGSAPASGSDLTFGTVNIGAYEYTSHGASGNPIRVSWALLQDAAFDIQGMLTRAIGTRIARAQAAHWCTGTGVSQPQGIVAASLTADVELNTADTPAYVDFLDTEGALDPAYEQNATWVMNKNSWVQIRGIVDGNDRPLILEEAMSGMGTRVPKALLGYPVIIDQGMPTLSSAADGYFAVLGDLREAYVIRRVANLAIVVNPWTRASQRQTEFTGWERADGRVQNRSAYVILSNNT
jgi:HK97 family phage major capsid protein